MPIVKQKRSPFYQVRRKVPEDLRVIVRKRELWRSLKTTDREVAKRRARKVEAEFDRVLDKARAQRSPKDINEVPEDTLIHLARKVYAEDLAKYADELLADPKGLSEGVWWIIDDIEDWLKGRWFGEVREALEKRVTDAGFTLSYGQGYKRAMQLVARAELEALKTVWAQAEGDFGYRPYDKLVSAPLEGPAPRSDSISVKDLIARFQHDPGRAHVSEHSKSQYHTPFKVLVAVVGNTTVASQVSREDCRRVREKLIERGLATPTINGYLTNLSALFEWAVREEYVEKNPARGLGIRQGIHTKDQRHPLSEAQLRRIFGSPDFQACRTERPPMYWCPLLSLFMSLRLTEAAQLLRADIKQIDGVWCVAVASDDGKNVKSHAGHRIIPVHPKLVELGFMEFVRGINTKRLFEDVPLDKSGYAGPSLGKRWTRLVKRLNADEPRTGYHSLRHNWADACRAAKVHEGIMKQAGGWAGSGGTSARYGSGYDVEAVQKELERIAPLPAGIL